MGRPFPRAERQNRPTETEIASLPGLNRSFPVRCEPRFLENRFDRVCYVKTCNPGIKKPADTRCGLSVRCHLPRPSVVIVSRIIADVGGIRIHEFRFRIIRRPNAPRFIERIAIRRLASMERFTIKRSGHVY